MSKPRPEDGFWRLPSGWVWLIFTGSMLIFCASMLTLREGRRFRSRPLQAPEILLVDEALGQWGQLSPQDPDLHTVLLSRQHQSLRAMDEASFARAQERNAFGYTDERARILLNPHLCFGFSSVVRSSDQSAADVVATLATLVHESFHLRNGSDEPGAYAHEWRFMETHREKCDSRLRSEWLIWEQQLPQRIQRSLGDEALAQVVKLRGDSGHSP